MPPLTPARIGLLGGTFNPPHIGHLAMARAARERLGLNLVLLTPGGDPPHKTPAVCARQRLCMTRLAAWGQPGVRAWAEEVRRPGVSYTAQTLRQLQARHPGAALYFLIGADALDSLPGWRGAEEIFALAHIVSFPRDGRDGAAAAAYLARRGARVTRVEGDVPPVSSSQVRQDVAAGRPAAALVGEGVERYLYRHGLYLPPEEGAMLAALRRALPHRDYVLAAEGARQAVHAAARTGGDGAAARRKALAERYHAVLG